MRTNALVMRVPHRLRSALTRSSQHVQARKALQGSGEEASISDADLIVALAAQSVAVCGGPAMPLHVGRTVATGGDPEGRLPREDFTAAQQKDFFAAPGFDCREMVCLLGAHTLGSKGFGDPAKFDNTYFQMLLRRPWADKSNKMADMVGLPSDHALPEDAECLEVIRMYASDNSVWQRDFEAAFTKLGSLGCNVA
jgi:L-ascorbate peroxidase